MASANVNWNPSVTPGVIKQLLSVKVNGNNVLNVELGGAETGHSFAVNPGDVVEVALFATNGFAVSDPVVATAVVPSKPASPTNLSVTFTP